LIAGIGSWKTKTRKEQFPILEQHLVEWVDRANSVHILVTDTVLRAATMKLIEKLSIPSNKEDYTKFALSNRWLFNLEMDFPVKNKTG